MEDIGGQAVIEGVMYRKKSAYSLAVRDSKGKLIIEKGYIKDLRIGLLSFLKLPVFRGMYAMAEMLFYGTKLLMRSASLSDPDEEDLSFWELFLVMLFSIGFAVLIFIVIPYILSSAVMVDEKQSPVLFNIVDAVFKLILFIAYVYAIRQMPDVLRIFRYHGAEHKVINAYESGENIVLANIKKYPTLHKRCSSSFIMLTIAVSIVVFSFAPLIAPYIFPGYQGLVFFWQKSLLLGLRLLLVPLVIGISYEVLKASAKHPENIFLKGISWPGLALQKLTTAEPDDKQLKVAIASFKTVREI